jgi:hypothetical protein
MAEYNDAWFVLIGGWIQVRASVTSMDMTMTPVTGSIACLVNSAPLLCMHFIFLFSIKNPRFIFFSVMPDQ